MNKKINNGIFYVAISLIVVVLGTVGIMQIIKAQVANSDVVELTALANSLDGNVDAFKMGVGYLANKIELDDEMFGSQFTDVYHEVTYHDEVQLKHPNATIEIPMQFRATTSDAATPQAGIAGQYINTEDPMLCKFPKVWLWDDVTAFAYSFGFGTTTRQDGEYLVATTSRSLMGSHRISSTTEDIGFDVFGGINTSTEYAIMGTYYDGGLNNSSSDFILETNDVVVIDVTYDGATSTESFTTGNADLTPGAAYLECTNIY